MKVQRYKWKCCDYDCQESIPFATGGYCYTHRFAKHVVDLLKMATIKDVAYLLGVSWDLVKFRDEKYFKLRQSTLHDCRIKQNVG